MSSSQSLSSYEILPSATRLVNLEGCFFFGFFLICKGWNTTQVTEAERRHLPSPITYWGTRSDAESQGFWSDPPPQSSWTWRFSAQQRLPACGRQNYHLHSQLRVLMGLVTSSSTAQLLFLLLFLLLHHQLGTRNGWGFCCFPPNEVRIPDQMLRAACFYVKKSDSTPGFVPGRDSITCDSCLWNC